MNCDSYFEIGSSHLVCQDYALTGTYKNMVYGIVSDGCSSADHSEIGAQVLCHVTRYFLTLYYDLFFNDSMNLESMANLLCKSIRTRADEIRKLYPISRDSLQATLLISVMIQYSDKRGHAFIFGWGDGVIIKRVSDSVYIQKGVIVECESDSGYIQINEIDYPLTNAPVYLMTDLEAYNKKFAGQLEKRIKEYGLLWPQIAPKIITGLYDRPYLDSFPINPGDYITIATDGLSQYQDRDKKPLKTELIIPQILDYPNHNGQFLKRTMNFMKRDLARKNWSHSDDIGLATLINN